jgi:flagellar biosynthesis protein FliR
MDFMLDKLLGFTMVLIRVSAFFLIAPVFSWKNIPVRFKVAMTFMLSIFFILVLPPFSIGTRGDSTLQAIILLSNEAIYGLALGLIAVLLFSAVRLCGQIIEQQMGLTMAKVMDPLTNESSQPLAMILEMIFVLLFLSANGHHMFLLLISRSYETFPVGTTPTIPILVAGITKASSVLLLAGLRLAAPILAAFLLLLVILAVFARISPEMNIMFISLPMCIGLGLIMVIVFLPLINTFVAEFADWMNKLVPL